MPGRACCARHRWHRLRASTGRSGPCAPVRQCDRIPEPAFPRAFPDPAGRRSEEHTSELQSLMRISYAVFCLKKKTKTTIHRTNNMYKVTENTKHTTYSLLID